MCVDAVEISEEGEGGEEEEEWSEACTSNALRQRHPLCCGGREGSGCVEGGRDAL